MRDAVWWSLPLTLLLWALAVLAWVGILAAAAFLLGRALRRGGGRHVALVRIEGAIGVGRGGVGASAAVAELARVRRDGRAAAVLLRVDSPGGAVAATEEIAREIARVRESGRPVVASVGNAALSGGFWVAVSADAVVAPAGALLGSIGVIVEKPELSRLFRRFGIGREVAKRPEHKDFMSPHRPWDEDERAFLEELGDEIFARFVDHVAERRRRPREEVLRVADGRVFTGLKGRELGFVDRIGNFEDALDLARELGHLPETAPLREYRRGLRLPPTMLPF